MATIHVNRSGTSLGTFSEDEVRDGLRAGRFLGTDLGWRDGMAEWQALSSMPEFSGGAVPGAIPPPTNLPPATAPIGDPVGGTRTGLPWENRATLGLVSGFFGTIKEVLTAPDRAFRMMRREGGLGEPLLFAVLAGTFGFIVALCYQLAFRAMGFAVGGAQNGLDWIGAMGIGVVFLFIISPILVAIFLFIWIAIVHVCLLIVGGAKQSFETTFRVLCYVHGSIAVLQLIPFCGGFVALVWSVIANSIGLARAHEIETGRAVLAILLPLILCCGFVVLCIFMAGGIAALQHR